LGYRKKIKKSIKSIAHPSTKSDRATATGWAFPPRTFALFKFHKSTSARSVFLLLASPAFCLTAQNFGGPQLITFQTEF
jgi:hypothetical protein